MSDSPAKKTLDFSAANKENLGVAVPVAGIPILDELPSATKDAKPAESQPEEPHEVLLHENPHRFVLFPIQHHEARHSPSLGRKLTGPDLAHVQEGHGLVLDRRGDRP
jgi:hypothetical protein